MALIARCPHCDARFRVREELAGKRARCRKCRETFTINEMSSEVVVLQPAEPGSADYDEQSAQGDDAPRLEDFFPADEDVDEAMMTEAAMPDVDAAEAAQPDSPRDAGAPPIPPVVEAPFPVPPVAHQPPAAQPVPQIPFPPPAGGPVPGHPPGAAVFPAPGGVVPPLGGGVPAPIGVPSPVATPAGPATAADVALHWPKMLHAAQWGLIWTVGMTLAALLNQFVNLWAGAAVALFATWVCYVGMISCVSFLVAREREAGACPSQGEVWAFFARNAVALVFGTAALGVAVALLFAVVFGGIAMLCRLETVGPILGGVLVIPSFLLILVAASVALNMYLLPVVIGVDDRGLIAAFRMIHQLAVRSGFAMVYRYLQAILSILPQLLFSVVLTTAAAAGALILCGDMVVAGRTDGDDLGPGMFLRGGSLLLIAAAWLSYAVVFVTVSFTLVYYSSTERRMPPG